MFICEVGLFGFSSLGSAKLMWRDAGVSKYLRESLGLRIIGRAVLPILLDYRYAHVLLGAHVLMSW